MTLFEKLPLGVLLELCFVSWMDQSNQEGCYLVSVVPARQRQTMRTPHCNNYDTCSGEKTVVGQTL